MLSIINPYTKTIRISCPTKRKEGIAEYEKIKDKIKKSTLQYGVAVSTYHFIFHTPIDGVSACLLYTSPSPRDRTRSRMPSSA